MKSAQERQEYLYNLLVIPVNVPYDSSEWNRQDRGEECVSGFCFGCVFPGRILKTPVLILRAEKGENGDFKSNSSDDIRGAEKHHEN